MNIPKIIEAIGNIDDMYLKEAELPERRRHFRFKPTLLAAIIAIIALSTSVAALNYTDYTAVNKKPNKITISHYDPPDSDDDNKEPSADTGNSALDHEEESTESAVAISYISSTSGLEIMKYSLDRYSGLKDESQSTEEETHPDFADLTPTRNSSGDYDYFYREFGEKIPNPEEFPWLESFEEYGVELENEGEFMTGDFRVSAVMCDDHYFYAVVQYALPEKAKKALKDIPEGVNLKFEYCRVEPSSAYIYTIPISIEEDVLTFLVFSRGYDSMPDEVEISLSDFGYISPESNWNFVRLFEVNGNITIPADKLKKMDNRISNTVKYPTEYGNVDITAQLSPFGIMFKLTSEEGKTLESRGFGISKLRIHLDDGRIYGSGKSYFGLYYILAGDSGYAKNCDDDDPTNDIYYISLPFAKAADIDKIEKLSIDGYELVFGD